MNLYQLTNDEVSLQLATALKAWRVSPSGAALSQEALAQKSGIGLTPLKRFEKTGGITLRNLIAILRAMDLLDNLQTLIPDPHEPGPLEVLAEQKRRGDKTRRRAPRKT